MKFYQRERDRETGGREREGKRKEKGSEKCKGRRKKIGTPKGKSRNVPFFLFFCFLPEKIEKLGICFFYFLFYFLYYIILCIILYNNLFYLFYK